MNKLAFRKVTNEDIKTIEMWLKKEHIRKWFHDTEDWLDEIKGRNNEYSWINHFIVMHNDKDIGFCQYYDCYNARELEDWYTVEEKNHTFSIDYLIGEESYLGKGFGKLIVKILTKWIETKEKGSKIVVQPEKDNHASCGILIANGYTYNEQFEYYFKGLK